MGNTAAKDSMVDNNVGTAQSTSDVVQIQRPARLPRRLVRPLSQEVPDVESLRLPFHVCRKIFVQLPLVDVYRCMLVCKEWRSLIDTCVFWLGYLEDNYDFGIREPPRKSPLFEWKHHGRKCLRLRTHSDHSMADTFIFYPFPDLWYSNIVVPYAMAPPQGSIDTYHHFLQALQWLDRLNWKLLHLRLNHVMVPCLLPWFRDRMPTSYEILALLRAHKEIIHHTQDAKPLNAQEMKHFYTIWNSNAGANEKGIARPLYEWVAINAPDKCILFDGNINICRPTPCFIITKLSPGWVGGLIYAVGYS